MPRAKKKSGQFIIIAAVLILIIMLSAVIFLYSNLPSQTLVVKDVAVATNSILNSINSVYSAGASMYSTILNVTGNYTYAALQARSVMLSGLGKLVTLYASYGLSLSTPSISFKAVWYSPYSYTLSQGGLVFNLSNYGVYGVNVSVTQELAVQVVCQTSCINSKGLATLRVYREFGKPDTDLQSNMFYFLVFNQTLSEWVKASPTSFTNYGNGTYALGVPSTSGSRGFLVGLRDSRGILVIASSFTKIVYNLNWGLTQTQAGNLAFVPWTLQILTNGDVQLLGQSVLSGSGQPVPPVPVKDIRVNVTVGSKSAQVPFQVEDWTFNYTQPLGLTGNYTLFSNFQMIVTNINTSVNSVTVYWNGTDTARPSKYSVPANFNYFVNTNNCGNYCIVQVSNGLLAFQFVDNGGFCAATKPDTLSINVFNQHGNQLGSINFEVVNSQNMETDCNFGFVVLPGAVREIAIGGFVYGEFLCQNGQTSDCDQPITAYNMFPTMVFLIPAKAPYITTFAITRFGSVSTGYNRQITGYTLETLSGFVGSVYVQTTTNLNQNQWSSTLGAYCVYTQGQNYCSTQGTYTYHLWSAICSSVNNPKQGSDPCNAQKPNSGILMANSLLSSLYNLVLTEQPSSPYAGITLSSRSISVSPFIELNSAVLSFNSAYTLTWTGFLWFWPGTQTVGSTQYNLDPYIVSTIFSSPPTVSVSVA